MENLPLTTASTTAPKAPMAPPSVGVATPRKMVPKTRKIKIRGGISTKVTCSANLESKPILVTRLTMDSAKPVKEATVIDMMMISSLAAGCVRPIMPPMI